MKKILFVCLGNICRSPLAEGILLHLNQKNQSGFTIDSAGTAGYHIGEAPDSRTINNARKHGVNLAQLRARQFTGADFDRFDLVLTMDKNNYHNVLKMAATSNHKAKTHLFLEYATGVPGLEVPDPYYGDEKDFENVFNMVYQACELLCEKLKQ